MNEMIIKLSILNQIATAKNSEKNKKISEKDHLFTYCPGLMKSSNEFK